MLWVPASLDPTSLTQNTELITDLLSSSDRELLGRSTLVRVVGSWSMRPNSSDADMACSFGIYITDADALAAAAVPEDIDNVSWIFKDAAYELHGDTSANASQYVQRAIDNKSKRRMRSPQSRMIAILENISATAVTLTALWNLRLLFRLP